MSEVTNGPWIHIGECPFCVNGLCRVRACDADDGQTHLYAMCDECEATWIEPTTDSEMSFPDLDDPRCPICARGLYGDYARWALPADLSGTDWDAVSIVVVSPTEDDDFAPEDGLPKREPPPISLDDAPNQFASDEPSPPSSTDATYGQDDPKPGC